MRVRNLIAFLTPTLLLLGLVWLAPPAFAAPAAKVQICHVPPGNPDNFHTIKIGEKALSPHLAHGDLGGACDENCLTLCGDGNACTVAECNPSGGCVPADPVDCDDQNLCTADSCDPGLGCENAAVICDPPDLCTVSMCAPDTGECVDSPVACADGEVCNLDTGDCDVTDPEKVIFVTSTSHNGNFGGLAGADAICNDLASVDPVTTPGNYVAWLSTSTVDAVDRLTPGSGPFINTNDETVALDIAGLVTENFLVNPVGYTEAGAVVPECGAPGGCVWTATDWPGGTLWLGNTSCNGWTDDTTDPGQTRLGDAQDATFGGWTNRATDFCNKTYPHYCIQK